MGPHGRTRFFLATLGFAGALLAAAAAPPAVAQDTGTEARPPVAAPAVPPAIDGRWLVGPGREVEFAGDRYRVFKDGRLDAEGEVRLSGDSITIRELPDGEERHGRITRDGDLLLIEPDDDSPMLLRATVPTEEAAPAAASALQGRWRTSDAEIVELRDGRYTMMSPDSGTVVDQGTYGVEGDTVTIHPQGAGEEKRFRWARVGDRVVVQEEGDDGEVIVLAPEPAAGAAEAPVTAPQPPTPPAEVAQQPVPPEPPAVPPAATAGQTETQAPPQPPAPPTELAQQPAAPQPPQLAPTPELPAAPARPVAPPAVTQPAPPVAGLAPTLTDGSPRARQWLGFLQGKRLVQTTGQGTQMMVQVLDLCSDGQYFWYAGAGGQMPLPQGTGYWQIVSQGEGAGLRLNSPVGAGEIELAYDGATAYLNRVPVQVLAGNASCR